MGRRPHDRRHAARHRHRGCLPLGAGAEAASRGRACRGAGAGRRGAGRP